MTALLDGDLTRAERAQAEAARALRRELRLIVDPVELELRGLFANRLPKDRMCRDRAHEANSPAERE
jgi:hypothetical protein